MSAIVKGLAIITAAAALALTPGAAAAKKPEKAKDRAAKVERTAKREGSAQQRCRDERKALGAPAFAAKYGKARTKGSAKAKAKAARAAFGRCVSQTAKRLRAEREVAEAGDELEGEEDEDWAEDEGEDEELAEDEPLGQDSFDDAPGVETPEPDDGGKHVDHEPGHEGKDPDEDGPGLGLGGEPDLG